MLFKNKFLRFQIFSLLFTYVLGTILHFTYEWSNENSIVALFSAVNESTWEHLKLLFFPMLITTIIGYFYLKTEKDEYNNFLCARIKGILCALTFVVVFFYTYTGIIGRNFAFLDTGVFLGEYVTFKQMKKDEKCNKFIAISVLTVLLFCFMFFTYNAPHIGLFRDPVSGGYGIGC